MKSLNFHDSKDADKTRLYDSKNILGKINEINQGLSLDQ